MIAPATEPPRVAFAVGRSVGGAVVRNRVRRQLRAALREHRSALRPGWGYLVGAAAPGTHAATYQELSAALGATLGGDFDGAQST